MSFPNRPLLNMVLMTRMGTKSQIRMAQDFHSFPMILDIDRRQFSQEAARLLGMVTAEFEPEILVGIRSGGYLLAEAMAEQTVPGSIRLVSLTRRRASTRSKNRLKLKQILGVVPRPVKNALRRLEHRYLMAVTSRQQVGPLQPDADEDRALRAALAAAGETCRILVVDDAVDSGATLLAVLRYIREVVAPAAEVRSAVITVTHTDPMVEPDYTLYRQVLCRFYWSSDFA